jgi:hypothetical protein
MRRATGTITAAVAVSDLTAAYEQSWNPFSSGVIRVKYTATNKGNVAVSGVGEVTVSDLSGLAGAPRPIRSPVPQLPGGSRNAAADESVHGGLHVNDESIRSVSRRRWFGGAGSGRDEGVQQPLEGVAIAGDL